jgi:hypothetical protein
MGQAIGLMMGAFIWIFRAWIFVMVMVPLRVWGWLWERPWPLGRRLALVLCPWVLVALLVIAPQMFVDYLVQERPAVTPLLQMEYRLAMPLVIARRAVQQKTSAVLLGLLESPRTDAPRSRRNQPTGGERLAGVAAVVFVMSFASPFLYSLFLGAPLWTVVHLVRRGRVTSATVAGRGIRQPRAKSFPRWRAAADRAHTWFAGASATGRGALRIDTSARLTHTWVVGATGTGKTQSVLLPMLRSDILAGRPVVFIDGKGDWETLAALWSVADQAGRQNDFRFFDLRRPLASCTYSPLLNGTANEQTDKIMAALRWDNEYYRSQSQSVLLRVLRALQEAGQPYTLDDLHAALSDLAAFRALTGLVPEAQRVIELDPIVSRWKDYQAETAGMRGQLESLLLTDFGELLRDPQPTLDLGEAYRNRSIVYIALPVARYPETAPLVAKLVIGDLNSVAGMVQDGRLEKQVMSVVVDEFAAFAMPMFIDLLNKGRSAGMAITISHQSMRGDLAAAGEGYVGQIADNTNVKICLRQSEDAEYVAGLAGTRSIVKRTEQTQASLLGEQRTGLGSAREADEYQISPNLVRQMLPGVALVKIDQPKRHLDLVVLDFFDTSQLVRLEPVEHAWPGNGDRSRDTVHHGIDLRRRARSPAAPVEVTPRPVPAFEGA